MMDVKEKLVYLVKNALRAYGKDLEKTVEPYEFIADFLIHSGVIVPPCEAGDFVYDIADGEIYKTKVLSLVYFGSGKWACRTVSCFPDIEEFGSRIFLTLEEAEKAIKCKLQAGIVNL